MAGNRRLSNMWRSMEDAAILSAIFSDVEEEEQDNGDNFVSDTIRKEDSMPMANTLVCAETSAETLKIDVSAMVPAKYAIDGATADLKCDLQRQEENDSTNTTRRGKRRKQSNWVAGKKVTVPKTTRKSAQNDPETVGKENIAVDSVCQDMQPRTRAKHGKPKRAVSHESTADDEATAD